MKVLWVNQELQIIQKILILQKIKAKEVKERKKEKRKRNQLTMILLFIQKKLQLKPYYLFLQKQFNKNQQITIKPLKTVTRLMMNLKKRIEEEMKIYNQDQHKLLIQHQKLKKLELMKLLLYQKKLYVQLGIYMIMLNKKKKIFMRRSRKI